MDRRDKKRVARRLQVHFWKRGQKTPFSGYTANISRDGMFIATASPLPRNTRIRIEILDEDLGFVVEGVVAHAARVSPQLQKLKASGMGVRLLAVEELVAELMPTSRPKKKGVGKVDAATGNVARGGAGKKKGKAAGKNGKKPAEDDADEASAEESAEEEESPEAAEAAEEAIEEIPDDEPLEPLPKLPEDEPRPAEPPKEPRIYPLRFSSLPNFLAVLQRDIEKGGVFIPTEEPAAVREKILVEIEIPAPVDRSVQHSAVVVGHTGGDENVEEISEDDGKEGDNLLRGMAVEFTAAKDVFDSLTELVYGD